MGRSYPALKVQWSERLDFLLAELDEFQPIAFDQEQDGEDGGTARVFFSSAESRDAAAKHLTAIDPSAIVESIDVPDENWAERSQASITAVRVGGLVIAPPWAVPADGSRVIIIQPSMGFGTAHHASTRLCLKLLQETEVAAAHVLDVGTGSGVLAIAALVLGARAAIAADNDPDALENVRENLSLNHITTGIEVRLCDLADDSSLPRGPFGVVLANLTGGVLVRYAAVLRPLVAPGGTLIVSGVMLDEEAEVGSALTAAGLRVIRRHAEEEWVGLAFSAQSRSTTH